MAETMSDRTGAISQPVTSTSGEASLSGLIKSLADDVRRLFSQEIALAKAEVSSAVKDIKSGMLSLAVGLGVLFAGFIVLLFAAVAGLSLVVAPWLAALIVGGVVAIVGLVLLMRARKALNPETVVPHRTMNSLRKDGEMVKRAVS
jgi:hypothetical protein